VRIEASSCRNGKSRAKRSRGIFLAKAGLRNPEDYKNENLGMGDVFAFDIDGNLSPGPSPKRRGENGIRKEIGL
jgi:hypothetical protein